MAERDVTLKLNVKADAVTAAAGAMRGLAADAGKADRATDSLAAVMTRAGRAARDAAQAHPLAGAMRGGDSAAQQRINAGLDATRQRLEMLSAALDPKNLRETVRLTLELQQAEAAYVKALARERAYQAGGYVGLAGHYVGGRAGAALQRAGGYGRSAEHAVSGLVGSEGAGGAAAAGAGAAVAGLAAGALLATEAIKGLATTALNFVGLANPGVMMQFDMAVADAKAVIGLSLTPVVEFLTEVMRDAGDVLANILPSGQAVKGLMDEFRPTLNELKQVALEVAPLVQEALVVGLRLAGHAVKLFAQVLHPVIELLKDWLGIAGLKPGQAQARGAAARPAQQYGDLVSAIEASHLAALSGVGADIQQAQLGALEKLIANTNPIDDIKKWLGGWEERMAKWWSESVQKLKIVLGI